MAKKADVHWTAEAVSKVEAIKSWISEEWGQKEADDFLDLLFHFENTIVFSQSIQRIKTL